MVSTKLTEFKGGPSFYNSIVVIGVFPFQSVFYGNI